MACLQVRTNQGLHQTVASLEVFNIFPTEVELENRDCGTGVSDMDLPTTEQIGPRSRRIVAPAKNVNSLVSVHEWFDNFYQLEVRDSLSRFKELRAGGPVVHGVGMDFGTVVVPDLWNWHDRPSAMALTFDSVSQMMTNPDTFGHRLYAAELGDQNPLFQDGPGHRHFRRMVIEAFNPRAVKDWEATARQLSDQLVDTFIARGAADLNEDFAQKLPGQVFAIFMGAPLSDSEKLSAWAVRQMSAFGDQAAEVIELLHGYFSKLIDDRRSLAPQDLAARHDLVSLLARVAVEGRAFNDVEINTTLHVLLIGGADTVYKGLSNTLYFLLTQDGALERVRQDRGLIPKAVEEAIRLASPNVFGSSRLALVDTELEGIPIKAGTAVIANISMANRDPARWEQPEEFDIDREQKMHLGWGNGPHTCLGMHLARLVIHSAINVLLDRAPGLSLDASRPMPELVGVGSQATKHLYVTFGQAKQSV